MSAPPGSLLHPMSAVPDRGGYFNIPNPLLSGYPFAQQSQLQLQLLKAPTHHANLSGKCVKAAKRGTRPACILCKHQKKKCTGEIPCNRCVSKGEGNRCRKEFLEVYGRETMLLPRELPGGLASKDPPSGSKQPREKKDPSKTTLPETQCANQPLPLVFHSQLQGQQAAPIHAMYDASKGLLAPTPCGVYVNSLHYLMAVQAHQIMAQRRAWEKHLADEANSNAVQNIVDMSEGSSDSSSTSSTVAGVESSRNSVNSEERDSSDNANVRSVSNP